MDPHFSSRDTEMGKATEKRIAVVTGANKGIGLEIVKQLASNGVMVLLTARDEKRGNEAVENLIESGVSDVLFHQLDVSDPASVASLAEFIKTKFGKLDILINNAGVGGAIFLPPEELELMSCSEERSEETEIMRVVKFIATSTETYETAEECLNTNYYGTKRVTEQLLPLLQLSESPTIVNLSSLYGKLELFQNLTNEKIKKQLNDTNGISEEGLDILLKSFLTDFKEGKVEANGWPIGLSAYKVSKLAINAYTRIMAKKFPTICINSLHPGFVQTDLTGKLGLMTTEKGAKGPVMLALLPKDGPSGCFYDEMTISSF
ncbi:hypothetical protein J5N97_024018 [Dioscorea zingiberensis]|uniref:Short-chain dehydrogenase/reductase n=1 Tax=Dioscorea zingiberensis TaxID=325984 RepID=A0A9D5C5W6_9LILI|nr:hypothetical protein J5N97_024018 [Dioscorea zingiberensis]